jgi:hypothetical protein
VRKKERKERGEKGVYRKEKRRWKWERRGKEGKRERGRERGWGNERRGYILLGHEAALFGKTPIQC